MLEVVYMVNINDMDIGQLVKFINADLQKNKNLSVNKWCDKVGIKKSTLKNKMSRENYKYNADLRQYVKEDITHNITPGKEETKPIKKIITHNITTNKDIDYDKLNLLLDNIDILLELVKKKDITHNITIDNKENTVKSLRINTQIYEKIKEKAIKENISISSIVNKALLDYLNNYI